MNYDYFRQMEERNIKKLLHQKKNQFGIAFTHQLKILECRLLMNGMRTAQPDFPSCPNPNPPPAPPSTRPSLSTAERQRRRQDNLCLNCGQAGHRAAQCPNPAKTGRLAFTLTADPDPTDPDPGPSDQLTDTHNESDPDDLYDTVEEAQGND